MKRKELFWILLLCLLWIGTLARSQPPTSMIPFQIVIEKIEFLPVTPLNWLSGYDTQVVLTLNHKGVAPAWWQQKGLCFYTRLRTPGLFYKSKTGFVEVPVDLSKRFHHGVEERMASWNKKKSRYEVRFSMRLSDLPKRSEPTVLRGRISCDDFISAPELEKCLGAPFEIVVRQSNQVVVPPQVSHDPMIEIARVEIEKYTPANAAQEKYDTEVRIYWKDKGRTSDEIGLSGPTDMVDAKGQTILSSTKELPNFSWASGSNQQGAHYFLRLNAVPLKQSNIILKGTHSLYGRWPLQISITLRQNGKELKGRLNKTQFQFEPLFITESP